MSLPLVVVAVAALVVFVVLAALSGLLFSQLVLVQSAVVVHGVLSSIVLIG